jgi:predicted DNA-binding protein
MSSATLTIRIPDTLLERFQQSAKHSQRNIEDIVIEAMTQYPPTTLEDAEQHRSRLPTYDDSQLWAVTSWRLQPLQENRRLHLTQHSKDRSLDIHEAQELETLLDLTLLYVALQAEALALLKDRGYDISPYLNASESE